MTRPLRSSDLEAFLDEALPPAEMARIEQALRQTPDLLPELATIHARRDAGVHGLGEIWRQHRLSCLSREQLGSYLLGVLAEGAADFVSFHLEVIGCRYCQANLADLRAQQTQQAAQVEPRRRRYFQTSAGYLKR
jgi:hypothetical protein